MTVPTRAEPDTIGVLIADDQALVRAGFRMILEIEPDMTVLGEAVDGDDAVQLTASLRPDVVLMDVRMPGTDGIAATRRLMAHSSGHPRVVMLTTFDMDEFVYEALSRPGRAGSSSRTCNRSCSLRESGQCTPATPCWHRP